MNFTEKISEMIETQLKRRGITSESVLLAMKNVPRHEFVSSGDKGSAYYDGPLSIGLGQTISQPYMVAVMTEAMLLKGGEKVLEIGTGSGYQSAVLAGIASEVFSIERHPSLAKAAQHRLKSLNYDNVRVITGDGTLGLPEHAPFDAIIVTAGSPHVPQCLKEQLEDGGRLVIPVGGRHMQSLLRVTKRGNSYKEEDLSGCVFVPLIGRYGWDET